MTIRQLGRKASVLFCTCLWLLASGCGSQASSGAPPAPRQEAPAPKQETAASKQATAAPEAKDAAAAPYVTAAENFGNLALDRKQWKLDAASFQIFEVASIKIIGQVNIFYRVIKKRWIYSCFGI